MMIKPYYRYNWNLRRWDIRKDDDYWANIQYHSRRHDLPQAIQSSLYTSDAKLLGYYALRVIAIILLLMAFSIFAMWT